MNCQMDSWVMACGCDAMRVPEADKGRDAKIVTRH